MEHMTHVFVMNDTENDYMIEVVYSINRQVVYELNSQAEIEIYLLNFVGQSAPDDVMLKVLNRLLPKGIIIHGQEKKLHIANESFVKILKNEATYGREKILESHLHSTKVYRVNLSQVISYGTVVE